MLRPTRIRPAALLAMLLLVLGLQKAWFTLVQSPGIDYYDFWVVPQAVASQSGINVYSEESRVRLGQEFLERSRRPGATQKQQVVAGARQRLDPVATPFLYTVFRPIATGDYERDYLRYQVLCLFLLIASVFFIGHSLRYSLAALFALAAVFSSAILPHVSELIVGNVNRLQLGFLAFFLLLRCLRRFPGRDYLSAVVLGCIVLFKPNLAPVAVVYLLYAATQRRFRKTLFSILGLASGAAIAVAASSVFFGSLRCWKDWTTILPNVVESIHPVSKGNYSVARIVFDRAQVDISRPLFAALLVLIGIVAVVARRPTRRETPAKTVRPREYREDVLAVGMGCAAALLAARLVWLHYYLLLVPLLMYSLRPRDRLFRESAALYLTRLGVSGVAILLLSTLTVPAPFGWETTTLSAVRSCGAAMLLFILGLVQTLSLKNDPPRLPSSP
ncbi:hypothetical protein JW916_14805 [Candidatus Sumerlaeota bacterium]|nr:hypothetical protein [Candidatus Sumerlaeota bacterium]